MRFAPALIALLAVGCYISQTDSESVARKFAESISSSQPGSAFALTSASFREKHPISEIESDARILAPCAGKIVKSEIPVEDNRERTYRFTYSELCGRGFSFQGVDVTVAVNGDRWQVVSYAPQAIRVVG